MSLNAASSGRAHQINTNTIKPFMGSSYEQHISTPLFILIIIIIILNNTFVNVM